MAGADSLGNVMPGADSLGMEMPGVGIPIMPGMEMPSADSLGNVFEGIKDKVKNLTTFEMPNVDIPIMPGMEMPKMPGFASIKPGGGLDNPICKYAIGASQKDIFSKTMSKSPLGNLGLDLDSLGDKIKSALGGDHKKAGVDGASQPPSLNIVEDNKTDMGQNGDIIAKVEKGKEARKQIENAQKQDKEQRKQQEQVQQAKQDKKAEEKAEKNKDKEKKDSEKSSKKKEDKASGTKKKNFLQKGVEAATAFLTGKKSVSGTPTSTKTAEGGKDTKEELYHTTIPQRNNDPKFINNPTHISHPRLRVEFLGEYGHLFASSEKTEGTPPRGDKDMDGQIISLEINRSMRQDAPSFSMNLVWRDDWYFELGSNDLVKITLWRPGNPLTREPKNYDPILVTNVTDKPTKKEDKKEIKGEPSPVDKSKLTEGIAARDPITPNSNGKTEPPDVPLNGTIQGKITEGGKGAAVNKLADSAKKTVASAIPTTIQGVPQSSSDVTLKEDNVDTSKVQETSGSEGQDDYNKEQVIFWGMVDEIRKNYSFTGNQYRRVITITGRGIVKALMNFDLDNLDQYGSGKYKLNLQDHWRRIRDANPAAGGYFTPAEAARSVLKALLDKNTLGGGGSDNSSSGGSMAENVTSNNTSKARSATGTITIQGTLSTSANVGNKPGSGDTGLNNADSVITNNESGSSENTESETVGVPEISSDLFDYKYGNDKIPLREMFDFRWEDHLQESIGFVQRMPHNVFLADSMTGNSWNMIKTTANAPWNELYWECYEGKPQLILRNTPFLKKNWAQLPCTYVPDSEIITENTGRNDNETYTIYWTVGPDKNQVYSLAPAIMNPELVGKFGITAKKVNTHYNFYPLVGRLEDCQLDMEGQLDPVSGKKIDYAGTRVEQVEKTVKINMRKDDSSAKTEGAWEFCNVLANILLYNYYCKNPYFLNGSITVMGRHQYHIGERIKTQDGIEWYVEGISHNITCYTGNWVTTLQLTRGIPENKRFTKPFGYWTPMDVLTVASWFRLTLSDETKSILNGGGKETDVSPCEEFVNNYLGMSANKNTAAGSVEAVCKMGVACKMPFYTNSAITQIGAGSFTLEEGKKIVEKEGKGLSYDGTESADSLLGAAEKLGVENNKYEPETLVPGDTIIFTKGYCAIFKSKENMVYINDDSTYAGGGSPPGVRCLDITTLDENIYGKPDRIIRTGGKEKKDGTNSVNSTINFQKVVELLRGGNVVPERIVNYNNAAIAAVTACMQQASEIIPENEKDNGESKGLLRWHSERRDKMIAWASVSGYPWNSVENQVDFMLYELSTNPDFAGVKSALESAEDTAEGAKIPATVMGQEYFINKNDSQKVDFINLESIKQDVWANRYDMVKNT